MSKEVQISKKKSFDICNPSVMGSSNTNIPLYPSLEKRGKGRFSQHNLKSPFIPLCQRGIKTPETEGLLTFELWT
jgi:hypothetical protein